MPVKAIKRTIGETVKAIKSLLYFEPKCIRTNPKIKKRTNPAIIL